MHIQHINHLHALALAATPGPWVVWEGHPSVYASTAEHLENTPARLGGVRMKVAECEFDEDYDFMGTDDELEQQGPYDGEANAAYIAALSPDVVIALLELSRAALTSSATAATPAPADAAGAGLRAPEALTADYRAALEERANDRRVALIRGPVLRYLLDVEAEARATPTLPTATAAPGAAGGAAEAGEALREALAVEAEILRIAKSTIVDCVGELLGYRAEEYGDALGKILQLVTPGYAPESRRKLAPAATPAPADAAGAGLLELFALRRFKAYVHERLDAAGIDKHEEQNALNGCRIGARLTDVLALRATPTLPTATAAPGAAAEAFEKLQSAYTKWLAQRPADEIFLRVRGKRSWTFGEMTKEMATGEPEALSLMISMMSLAAHLVSTDKSLLDEADEPAAIEDARPHFKALAAVRDELTFDDGAGYNHGLVHEFDEAVAALKAAVAASSAAPAAPEAGPGGGQPLGKQYDHE
ncbi:hypothetical protein ACVWYF_004164 [Hymenobacter sp. UYAg731]